MAPTTTPSSSSSALPPPPPDDDDDDDDDENPPTVPNGYSSSSSIDPFPPSLLPGGRHSLAGISLRAFLLGAGLGASLALGAYLALLPSPLWRAAFFAAALALFHFLEFAVTAAHNTPLATPAAFLLASNGRAYNAAHSCALLETVLAHALSPSSSSSSSSSSSVLLLALGLALVVLGQAVRSLAMARAGRSFNHTVQARRRAGHVLVTSGVYARLRHPSYFGFFWWGVGTQLVLANRVCLVVYAVVLWRFFRARIRTEEEYLVAFFGDEYVRYRARTWVGIPFIR